MVCIVILFITTSSFIAGVIFILDKYKPGAGSGLIATEITAAGIIYAKW
jgi:hypothetical protein